MHRDNLPINGPIFLEKTHEFADQFSCKDFQASNGWLREWKKRYVAHLFGHG